MRENLQTINKLYHEHELSDADMMKLINCNESEDMEYLMKKAVQARESVYGRDIYIRGLIEISNICRNDCLYCGIRKSNKNVKRYRLSKEDILSCADKGYKLGFRTFVLQGGEDIFFSDDFLCELISEIKGKYRECAVTLSLGERSLESYQKLYEAGADRYLLRHETATKEHYEKLHPTNMSFDNRIKCLEELKSIGYQTGCGMMIGSPYQTDADILRDIRFIEKFRPHMVGIGPFIPHEDTCFAKQPAGSVNLTLRIMAIIRLMMPNVLLPSTTALATLCKDGHRSGIMAGCNVIMPNLSPDYAKDNYTLYNNKANTGTEDALKLALLSEKMSELGYKIVTERGDYKNCNKGDVVSDV